MTEKEIQPKQEQGEPVAEISRDGVLGVDFIDIERALKLPNGTKLYTTPQPKQEQGEPVAWMHKRSGRLIGHKPYGSIDEWDSLYTTPQQRKPLTDEQIKTIFHELPDDFGIQFSRRFARAIEAAHGITKEKT
jgi:hypothetical protein